MKKINVDILRLQQFVESDSITTITLEEKNILIAELLNLLEEKKQIEELFKSQVTIQQSIIALQDKKYEDITASFRAENLMLTKQIRKSNIKSGLIQTAVIVTAIVIPLILIK